MVSNMPDFKARNLIIAKALFFCGCMSTVGWGRFQNIFYLQSGLTASQVGTLKSIGLTLKFIGEPLWVMIADLTDQKMVFTISILIQILTMEMLRMSSLSFSSLMFIRILRTATTPSSTFTTAVSFVLTNGTQEGYGHQRMYGSVAWGVGAFLAGYLIDQFGFGAMFLYTYFFNISNLVMVYGCVPSLSRKQFGTSSMLPQKDFPNSTKEYPIHTKRHQVESQDGAVSKSASSDFSRASAIDSPGVEDKLDKKISSIRQYLVEFSSFFKNPCCRAILLTAAFYGTVMMVPDVFLYISLEKDFSVSRSFSGLCTTISAFSDIPIFWYSDQLLKMYGHHAIMLTAQVVCIVRLLMYSLLTPAWSYSPYIIAGCQLIHGCTFALFWAATVDAIRRLAPPELTVSSIGSLNTIYFTLGGIVGNSVWGLTYDYYGIFYVYIGAALITTANCVHFALQEELMKNGLRAAGAKPAGVIGEVSLIKSSHLPSINSSFRGSGTSTIAASTWPHPPSPLGSTLRLDDSSGRV